MHQSQFSAPLERRHMPGGFGISLDRYIGRQGLGRGYVSDESRIPGDFGPAQPMRGFENTYRNIIDYIVRITYRIWEDRDVKYIGDTYSENSRVYDDYGLQLGNSKIISDTHHTTGAFSNIRLIADEIIWAGNDETGFHTSHRTLIRGTNDGDSKYGPATGRDVDVLVIANCVSLENEIFLEHVLYNNSSLLLQLGHDLDTVSDQLVGDAPAGWPRKAETWQALRTARAPLQPIYLSDPVDGFDVDRFERELFSSLWNRRDDSVMGHAYAPDFSFQGTSGRVFNGGTEYRGMLNSLRTAFPDLELQVDEVYWMGNDADGYLVSVRWSADATHRGSGPYGDPTDAAVQVWGITQHHLVGGRIVSEWTLFNELDLMMQIADARRR